MKYYEARASIASAPAAVWSVLEDSGGYAAWDSGITKVEGSIASDERIKVHTAVSPKRAFPVTVQIDRTAGVMTWTGGMPLGLFRGVRTFRITATERGTEFAMREEFTGPLLGLIWRSMPDLAPSFAHFAAGLTAQVERVHPAGA